MFTVIALVCQLGQAPSECVPQTAVDRLVLGHVANEWLCISQSQFSLARTDLANGDYYIKTICEREQ